MKLTSIFNHLKDTAQTVLDQFLPRQCSVCGKILSASETDLCQSCLISLPLTNFHKLKFNEMEQLFAGRTPICRATGYFFYEKASPYANILHDVKYRNMPQISYHLSLQAAHQLQADGFFAGIDAIIPVPMHKLKKAMRGYNQAEQIALAISKVIGVPVVNNIKAIKPHETQTHNDRDERWENAQEIYASTNTHELVGKHVLLVDDVVTTGSTLLACAKTIENVPNITISIFTLAVSHLS